MFGVILKLNSNNNGMDFLRAMHNIGKLNLSDELNIMAKSEMIIISTILKSDDKEIRVCDIAKRLNVSTPAVSRTLSRLEQKGYIKRTIDKTDRRNTHIKTTQKGKDAFCLDMKIMSDFMNNSLKHLDSDEINQLICLVKKLQNGIESELQAITKKTNEKDTINNG